METKIDNEFNKKATLTKILSQSDLYDILPFGRTKVNQLIKSGQLPVVKIGKDYITTYKILEDWISNNIGEEIYY